MYRGWIKLFRKLLDSRVFHNEGLLKIFIWCLLKANRKEDWVPFKTGKGSIEVHLIPGQFIFGRFSAADELKMNPSTLWKRMKKLETLGNLIITSHRQYSIITIVNWNIYQPDISEGDKQSDSQETPKELASDTNNNVKNVEKFKGITDFSEKSKRYLELISNACEEIESMSRKSSGRFDVVKWVQVQINNGGHLGAIQETLVAIIDYWNKLENPWGYANSVMKTKNHNWNEKEHIKRSQRLKENQELDPNIAKIVSRIG